MRPFVPPLVLLGELREDALDPLTDLGPADLVDRAEYASDAFGSGSLTQQGLDGLVDDPRPFPSSQIRKSGALHRHGKSSFAML